MDRYARLGEILSVSRDTLFLLDREMSERTGKTDVMKQVFEENQKAIEKTKTRLASGDALGDFLEREICNFEKNLKTYIQDHVKGEGMVEKIVALIQTIAPKEKGFFLTWEKAKEILEQRPPRNLLKFLDAKTVDELFRTYDLSEVFCVLRFVEEDTWMHETFDRAYREFKPDDFEEREIQIKVLGAKWMEIAKTFVQKKHHNVSHLKEFGVIFLNPIEEEIPGKWIRDVALLLHYIHEIHFYSKLFRRFSRDKDFSLKLISLLRGDVSEKTSVEKGEWLIVQRYLWKENPEDPRLFLPRVNPESMHWMRAERNLFDFGKAVLGTDFSIWKNHAWVAEHHRGILQSYDFEDNAISAVSRAEGKESRFWYHEREALWTKLFMEYAGGEKKMEELLMKDFIKGSVLF